MKPGAAIRREAQVHLGTSDAAISTLVYVKQGRRENAAFAYSEDWLASPDRFAVSPELSLTAGYRTRKAASPHDSVFHGAIADTAPDAWGRRVIARDHAKRRSRGTPLEPLTELDYLLAVDDFSRVGALRFSVADHPYSRTVEGGRRRTPPLVALRRVYEASRAVELGQESAADLRYLQGKGTSLGGMRPKCTVLDEDGRLAIGKFPSVGDTRAVTRGEVLALRLAQRAGIDAAEARIVDLEGVPVAVIQRFDRDVAHARIPYISAATLLEASREEERAYTEIADAIRAHGREPKRDVQQLFRRMLFNLLITNVDDHLQNHGLLHVEHGLWRLAPAFDLNPFPDKERESKTWLSEEDGPITDVRVLMGRRAYFSLSEGEARAVLAEVHRAVLTWREVAQSPEVGLPRHELVDFAAAFEHEQMDAARAWLASAG